MMACVKMECVYMRGIPLLLIPFVENSNGLYLNDVNG